MQSWRERMEARAMSPESYFAYLLAERRVYAVNLASGIHAIGERL